jgi:hypothetical protein
MDIEGQRGENKKREKDNKRKEKIMEVEGLG